MESEVQFSLILVAVAGVAISFAYWRQAIVAAMLLLLFEGALRKWALPGAQAWLYLAKDFLLLGAYVGFAATKGVVAPVRQAQPVIFLLALTAAYGTLELLNPALPSFVLGLVGWRAYFFYAPLLLLVPHLFASPEQLLRALRGYALLALPLAALGILQFYSPMDSAINSNVQHEPGVGGVVIFHSMDRVRVAGPFAFVSGYTSYLLFAAVLIGALLAVRGWRFRDNVALYVALALIVAAMFATGSRAPVYSLIAAAVVYAAFAAAMGDLSLSAALRACVGAAVLGVAVWYFLPEPAEAFRYRASGVEDTMSRFVSPFVEPFLIFEKAGLMGYGIGTAHQSAVFLVGSAYPWWTDGFTAEAETSRVMLELGMVGFVLVFLLRTVIAVIALRAAFMLKSRAARSLALILALYLGLQIFGAVIFDPTADVLYWFAVGLLFALERFEEREARAANARRIAPDMRLQRHA